MCGTYANQPIMTDAPDLDAYFRRIGYDGPREPTLAVLRELHALHPRVADKIHQQT